MQAKKKHKHKESDLQTKKKKKIRNFILEYVFFSQEHQLLDQ